MGILTDLLGGGSVFSILFGLEFALILYFSFVGLVNFIRLDGEIRSRYQERAAFINDFYRVYLERKQAFDEQLRLEEEARLARIANTLANSR